MERNRKSSATLPEDQSMATTALIPFQFDTYNIQVHMNDDGNPWWVLQDICAVFALSNPSKVAGRLKASESTTLTFSYKGQQELKTLLVNEKGLYRLIMRSNKPEAERFQDWVFQEVLPQIRKTGQYTPTLPQVKNPANQLMIDTIVRLDTLEQADQRREAQLIEQQQEIIALQAQQIEGLKLVQSAEGKADVANSKADTALAEAHRMTVEHFIMTNGLLHQFPPSEHRRISDWLRDFCLGYGWHVRKEPVYGKPWPEENVYPLHAFSAWLRHEQTRPRQQALRVI